MNVIIWLHCSLPFFSNHLHSRPALLNHAKWRWWNSAGLRCLCVKVQLCRQILGQLDLSVPCFGMFVCVCVFPQVFSCFDAWWKTLYSINKLTEHQFSLWIHKNVIFLQPFHDNCSFHEVLFLHMTKCAVEKVKEKKQNLSSEHGQQFVSNGNHMYEILI